MTFKKSDSCFCVSRAQVSIEFMTVMAIAVFLLTVMQFYAADLRAAAESETSGADAIVIASGFASLLNAASAADGFRAEAGLPATAGGLNYSMMVYPNAVTVETLNGFVVEQIRAGEVRNEAGPAPFGLASGQYIVTNSAGVVKIEKK
jgi:hypothetical protein